jgi:hypothetical protein
MDPDKRTAWLRQLDQECPYQVVLPRQQLADDSEILNFLVRSAGKFDMYVEDDYARVLSQKRSASSWLGKTSGLSQVDPA